MGDTFPQQRIGNPVLCSISFNPYLAILKLKLQNDRIDPAGAIPTKIN